jgi:hypothetical protein
MEPGNLRELVGIRRTIPTSSLFRISELKGELW